MLRCSTGPGIRARANYLNLRAQAYQGYATLMRDLVSGTLPAAFMLLGSAPEAEADGRLRALALTRVQRWPSLTASLTPSLTPSLTALPTLGERALCDLAASETFGLFLPAKTAPAKVQELHQAVSGALSKGALNGLPGGSLRQAAAISQGDYAEALAAEHAMWRRIVARERFVLPI